MNTCACRLESGAQEGKYKEKSVSESTCLIVQGFTHGNQGMNEQIIAIINSNGICVKLCTSSSRVYHLATSKAVCRPLGQRSAGQALIGNDN